MINTFPPDMPPGAELGSDMKEQAHATVQAALDHAQGTLAQIQAIVAEQVVGCIASCSKDADHCSSCIEGTAKVQIDSARGVVDKIIGKMIPAFGSTLRLAVTYGQPILDKLRPGGSGNGNRPGNICAILPDMPGCDDVPPPVVIPPVWIEPPEGTKPPPSEYQPPVDIGPPTPKPEPGPGPGGQCCPPPPCCPPCPTPGPAPMPGPTPEPEPMPGPGPGPMPMPGPGPGPLPGGLKRCPDGSIVPEWYECPPFSNFQGPVDVPPPGPGPGPIIPPTIVPPGGIIPPKPPLPVNRPVTEAIIDWSKCDLCDVLTSAGINIGNMGNYASLTRLAGFSVDSASGKRTAPQWMIELMRNTPGFVGETLYWTTFATLMGVDALGQIVPIPCGKNSGIYTAYWAIDALLDLVNKWTGISIRPVSESVQHTLNWSCPTQLPGQVDVDGLWWSKRISDADWECLTRANDNIVCWAEKVRENGRQYLDPAQQWAMVRRGIVSKDRAKRIATENQRLDSLDFAALEDLTKPLPGPSDLIRMMLRDVADETVATDFKLDQEFIDKFKGQLKQWSEWQGIPEDVMKYEWRAHWEWPSPTQLYEMLHRLRKDHPNPDNAANAIDATLVKQVLGVNDVIPMFRDKLVQIAYRPITRMDARRMFQTDVLDKKRMFFVYTDLGYSDSDAKLMVEWEEKVKDQKQAAGTHYWTPRSVAKAVADGVMTESAGLELLGQITSNGVVNPTIISEAVQARDLTRRKQFRSAVKLRFKYGEITDIQAVSLLIEAGFDQGIAEGEVQTWVAQQAQKPKQATAAMLCDWHTRGFITTQEYLARLIRLGWPVADAERIAGTCIQKAEAKSAGKKSATSSK